MVELLQAKLSQVPWRKNVLLRTDARAVFKLKLTDALISKRIE